MSALSTNTFVVGEVYYRVTYPDREMRLPGIESFVCVGSELSDQHSGDTWYFQPASDFGRFGSALAPGMRGRPVICVSHECLAEMLDIDRLLDELRGAARRRGE